MLLRMDVPFPVPSLLEAMHSPGSHSLGREQSFLLPSSTSSKGGSSLCTLCHVALWVSQTFSVLCLDVLCWPLCIILLK